LRVVVPPAAVTLVEVIVWLISSDAVPETPSVEAEMVVVPFPTAVAMPLLASIVATPDAEELHVNVFPDMSWPSWSLAVATNCCVSPRAARIGFAGVTAIDDTMMGAIGSPPHVKRAGSVTINSHGLSVASSFCILFSPRPGLNRQGGLVGAYSLRVTTRWQGPCRSGGPAEVPSGEAFQGVLP
jgi:hypothetical protein